MERLYTDIQASSLDEWSETKDQALISYYLQVVGLLLTERAVFVDKVNETDLKLENLHNTFGHLRDKYPEEFV